MAMCLPQQCGVVCAAHDEAGGGAAVAEGERRIARNITVDTADAVHSVASRAACIAITGLRCEITHRGNALVMRYDDPLGSNDGVKGEQLVGTAFTVWAPNAHAVRVVGERRWRKLDDARGPLGAAALPRCVISQRSPVMAMQAARLATL